MSGAAPRTAWQRPELVATFLAEREQLLPQLDVQEDLVERLSRRSGRPLRRFLDVGAGDGAMTRLMRRVEPEAQSVLVHYSEPMLARARDRPGRSGP